MLINLDTMNKLHDVQYEMLKQLIDVMEQLSINYYFVHGSLLGAIRQHDFIIEDDDIDIAIFRDDYNKLIIEGNKLLPKKYFIQSSQNDEFPLAFAKMRNSETTFRQPVLRNYNCNQGIYIDIFPIDYCTGNKQLIMIRSKLMNIRINSKMDSKDSVLYSLLKKLSIVIYPSINNTMKRREKYFTLMKKSDRVSIFGGKTSEFDMPIGWFGKGLKFRFRDIDVNCPDDYSNYLKRIYGDEFMNYNPAKERMGSEGIEVSADIIDFETPYTLYTH